MRDTQSHTASLNAYSRVAGISYVIIILLGIFSVSFVETSLFVPGDSTATVNNVLANELRFRIGLLSEIIMYALVVLLSLSLYVILKTVNRDLALLALLWRLGEAIIGGVAVVIGGLFPLLLLEQRAAFETAQLPSLAGPFLDLRNAGLDVVLIFIGFGGTLFCYLFFRSRYIPRILAAWGMFTYASMLVLAVASILMPGLPESVKIVLYAPGALFELTIGLWLSVKGLDQERLNERVSGRAR